MEVRIGKSERTVFQVVNKVSKAKVTLVVGESRVVVDKELKYSSEREVKRIFGGCGWKVGFEIESQDYQFLDCQEWIYLDN